MKAFALQKAAVSRSPHGERGLKYCPARIFLGAVESLPARGAWVEIKMASVAAMLRNSRSPHGERGLKLKAGGLESVYNESLPARGAWVEIITVTPSYLATESLPARGAWVEMIVIMYRVIIILSRSPHGERGLKYMRGRGFSPVWQSLPARGAWVEIRSRPSGPTRPRVAPRTGSVG